MNRHDFVDAMRDLIDLEIFDFAEALFRAMDRVRRYTGGKEVLYFGRIGDGTFFAAGEIDSVRWYEDTTPAEALNAIRVEFGDDYADIIEEEPCWY